MHPLVDSGSCSSGRQRVSLEAQCRAALVAGARANGTSRQRARAAARRFVRRHRRNVAYLSWVLRSVAASSALAVLLLNGGATPASAAGTLLVPANTPLFFAVAGGKLTPAFGDLDGDGDLDMLAGSDLGTFTYHQNIGDAVTPTYVQRTGALNPLDGENMGSSSAPTLGDLDGDGDLDLVASDYLSGSLTYYKNTGDKMDAVFTEQTGPSNPFDGLSSLGLAAKPALGDLDGDGDLDIVVGGNGGKFKYLRNDGAASVAFFVEIVGTGNPLDGEDAGIESTPALADLDGDGDLDLISGTYFGKQVYYENIGDASSPAFAPRKGDLNPIVVQTLGSTNYHSAPAFADLDGDGDFDLATGVDAGGNITYRENAQRTVVLRDPNALSGEDVGFRSRPALGDLDGDGDLDLVSGEINGTFVYYENTTSNSSFVAFTERIGASNPLDGETLVGSGGGSPALGDLDGDGDLDLVSGDYFGGIFYYYENTGSPASPAFTPRTGAQNPLDGLVTLGFSSTPQLGDLDGDGDLDLVSGSFNGTFHYYENTGSRANAVFVERTGGMNPLPGDDLGQAAAPALGDFDGDGDLDLLAGEQDGTFFYYENTGTTASPEFTARTGLKNPLGAQDFGAISLPSPTFGDFDGDGDLDVLVGHTDGRFDLFENAIISASSPTVVQRTGAANPLDGKDVGGWSTPVLVDIDSDGDLDVAVGHSTGRFAFFENTGNIIGPAFTELVGGANPLDGMDVGFFSAPAFGDWAAASSSSSGFSDVIMGASDGRFYVAPNHGNATSPFLLSLSVTGPTTPMDGQDVGNDSTPVLADLDGDGDLDVLSGQKLGTFLYYENTGNALTPVYTPRGGALNPLNGEDVGESSAPALADVDKDGDLDLVSGEWLGSFFYYENTGDVTNPVFVNRTGADNPFDGLTVGARSNPAFGDLDGDGNLDLVVGLFDGTLRTFEIVTIPEPAPGLLASAAIAVLGLMGNLRSRMSRNKRSIRSGPNEKSA